MNQEDIIRQLTKLHRILDAIIHRIEQIESENTLLRDTLEPYFKVAQRKTVGMMMLNKLFVDSKTASMIQKKNALLDEARQISKDLLKLKS